MRCLTILMIFPISVTEPSHNIKLLRVGGEETFCSRKLCVRTPPLPLDWTYTGLTHAGSTNATLDNAGKGLIIMCPMINMRIECVVVSVLRVRIKYIINIISVAFVWANKNIQCYRLIISNLFSAGTVYKDDGLKYLKWS